MGYEQSFTLSDLKLALGYLTVAISVALFAMDKKFSFKDTYYITVTSILVYFIISAVLLYLTSSKKYKNNKFIGYNDNKQKVLVAAWTSKYDPIYNMELVLNDDQRRSVSTQIEFSKFFDSHGYFKRDAFISLIKNDLKSLEKKDI